MLKYLFLLMFMLYDKAFSQKFILQVDEVRTFYGDTSQTLVEIFEGTLADTVPTPTHCRYIIDGTNNTVEFYRNDSLEIIMPMNIDYYEHGMLVHFLIQGFDVGLMVNFNHDTEYALYFNREESYVRYFNFTKYDILKCN